MVAVTDYKTNYMRQTQLFNPEEHNGKVIIIGLGNIGSNAALTLARMGITSFELWDDDTIENHNLSSQQYNPSDLGFTKVVALTRKLHEINSDIAVDVHTERFTTQEFDPGAIILIGVDTAEGRKEIAQGMRGFPKFLIDARIGGHQLEVYTFTNKEDWLKTIPAQSFEEPCGGRFICYVSIMTGAIIANQIKKLLRGEKWSKSLMINVDSLDIMKNFEW